MYTWAIFDTCDSDGFFCGAAPTLEAAVRVVTALATMDPPDDGGDQDEWDDWGENAWQVTTERLVQWFTDHDGFAIPANSDSDFLVLIRESSADLA